MYRDFTYVDDLVRGISLLINKTPSISDEKSLSKVDSLSNVAPYRVVNIGNSEKIKLLDFIDSIEEILDKKAIRNYMPMQKGDVSATWADSTLLKDITDYTPKTNFKDGIAQFIKWYQEYYNVKK
jgi:UDP-glucuronate 4-epimerase